MNNWGNFVFNSPYVGEEITTVNDVVLPIQYLEFMQEHNGGEGDIGESWLVLYPLEDLQEINDDYEINEYLPNNVIIGSNGSEELYGIDSEGNYFNIPTILDEDNITVLDDDLKKLPEMINDFWESR